MAAADRPDISPPARRSRLTLLPRRQDPASPSAAGRGGEGRDCSHRGRGSSPGAVRAHGAQADAAEVGDRRARRGPAQVGRDLVQRWKLLAQSTPLQRRGAQGRAAEGHPRARLHAAGRLLRLGRDPQARVLLRIEPLLRHGAVALPHPAQALQGPDRVPELRPLLRGRALEEALHERHLAVLDDLVARLRRNSVSQRSPTKVVREVSPEALFLREAEVGQPVPELIGAAVRAAAVGPDVREQVQVLRPHVGALVRRHRPSD
mmetsp:Transcript_74518/g.197815  ORF Transcript_74518/g.197815 Transcript_74518/m.197815 type:complete len:262 (-) Transcript_74518:339-1124(-)